MMVVNSLHMNLLFQTLAYECKLQNTNVYIFLSHRIQRFFHDTVLSFPSPYDTWTKGSRSNLSLQLGQPFFPVKLKFNIIQISIKQFQIPSRKASTRRGCPVFVRNAMIPGSRESRNYRSILKTALPNINKNIQQQEIATCTRFLIAH